MQPGLSKVSFEVSDEAYLIGLADDDPFPVRLHDGLWRTEDGHILPSKDESKDAFPQ